MYRRYLCVRQQLVRQWLATELQSVPTAAITGEVEDINLSKAIRNTHPYLDRWMKGKASVQDLDEALGGVNLSEELPG